MNNKQIKDFTEWLGVLYLDFDNEDKHYVKVVKNEIKEKILSYKKTF